MKKISILILTALILASCHVKFVPGKSQQQIDLTQHIQDEANSVFTNSDLSFATNEPALIQINTDIDSLLSYDQLRKKKIIVNQDLQIQSVFNSDANAWQTKGSISPGIANSYKIYFKSIIDPRIVSENSLK